MQRINRATLEKECRIFGVYLTGREPARYVVDHYVRAHERRIPDASACCFEGALTAVARQHPTLTRLADGYARFFARRSALRGKLVLLLALLETSAPSYRWLDDVPAGTRTGAAIVLLAQGALGTIFLLLGVMLFTPIRLLAAVKKTV